MNARKEILIKCGLALYGVRWQTDLARDLGLSDGRRVRQWLSGDRPIPDGVWKDIERLLTDRKSVIDDAMDDLLKIIPTNA